MYARATTGSEDNNDEFSPCSRSQMLDVIVARGQDATRGCFTKRNYPFYYSTFVCIVLYIYS